MASIVIRPSQPLSVLDLRVWGVLFVPFVQLEKSAGFLFIFSFLPWHFGSLAEAECTHILSWSGVTLPKKKPAL